MKKILLLCAMVIAGCVDSTDTFTCTHDGRGYSLIFDEQAVREVNGTQIFSLAFCGADCSPKTYSKIGDLFFFSDDRNNLWVFDKGKMTLKFEDEDKTYRCYLEEDR